MKKTASLALAFSMLVGMITMSGLSRTGAPTFVADVAANSAFIITNPYEDVNWTTTGRYRAGLHNHTTNSDGNHSLSTMAEEHYRAGYHIVSFTDHSRQAPWPDKVPTGAMTAARTAEMAAGSGRSGAAGMIFVPYTNERSVTFDCTGGSACGANCACTPYGIRQPTRNIEADGRPRRHHVNTYWAASRVSTISFQDMLHEMRTLERPTDRVPNPAVKAEGTGIAHLNHLGRFTGAEMNRTLAQANAISNDPAFYRPYARLLRENPNLIGMEIVGKFDPETQGDRVIWDNILKENMQHGVPVWGFASDDAHHQRAIGFAYNIMLMPELTLCEFRNSMQSGAFLAFSRVDRQYGIFPGAIGQAMWVGNELNTENMTAVRNRATPEIESITVAGDTIFIVASGHDTIRWYSDGTLPVATGATLTLPANFTGTYVRATVASNSNGVLYTQPFGVRPAATVCRLPVLESIMELPPVTASIGAAATVQGLGLPAAVNVRATTTTSRTNAIHPAPIRWNLNGIAYNPAITDVDQTFTVTGVVRPTKMTVPAGTDLGISVQVTVEAYVCHECSEQTWALDFSRLTTAGAGGDANLPAEFEGSPNMRSLGSTSYRPGVRRESGANNPLIMVGSAPFSSFKWANLHTSRVGLNIETGSATGIGGTNSSRPSSTTDPQAFNPRVGETYELRMTATGTGTLIIHGARAGDHSKHPQQTVTLSEQPQEFTHIWVQNSGGGNVFMELSPAASIEVTAMSVHRLNTCGGGSCGSAGKCCPDYPECECGICDKCDKRPCECIVTPTCCELFPDCNCVAPPCELCGELCGTKPCCNIAACRECECGEDTCCNDFPDCNCNGTNPVPCSFCTNPIIPGAVCPCRTTPVPCPDCAAHPCSCPPPPCPGGCGEIIVLCTCEVPPICETCGNTLATCSCPKPCVFCRIIGCTGTCQAPQPCVHCSVAGCTGTCQNQQPCVHCQNVGCAGTCQNQQQPCIHCQNLGCSGTCVIVQVCPQCSFPEDDCVCACCELFPECTCAEPRPPQTIYSMWGVLNDEILEQLLESDRPRNINLGTRGNNRVVTIYPHPETQTLDDARVITDLCINIATVTRPANTPANSVMINPADLGGAFGFELGFIVTEAELKAAGLAAQDVKVFRVTSTGAIVEEGRILARNDNGSVVVGITCSSNYILTTVRPGLLTGGDGPPGINDALAILRSIIGLPNVMNNNKIAFDAANITRPGTVIAAPIIDDGLAVLRFIIGLDSPLDAYWKAG